MAKAFNSLSSRNKFAKRHYEAVALAMQDALRDAMTTDPTPARQRAVNVAIECLADVFASDNGQFKRDRFISACVPGANVKARNGGAR
jgi:hypothetical protein